MFMQQIEYSDIVKDHFRNPRNTGTMVNANAIGEDRNPVCGDHTKLFLFIENEKIKKASFLTRGCAAAIATSSAATEMIIGLTIKEARCLRKQDFVDNVGGLPKSKVHCSVLVNKALEKALASYEGH